MVKFDLLEERWIPCIMVAGDVATELSLREALTRAHEVRMVSDPSPLVTLALHRLMLAVLHRVFGPESPDEWAALWQNGWDSAQIEAYFDREGVRDRFDLFSTDRPFFQAKSLDFKDEKPISNLAHQIASSANPVALFDHTLDCQMAPAEAARYVVAFQAYAVAGLLSFEKPEDRSADAAPLVKGAAALVRGETLFQTLMLNLHRYSRADSEPCECQGDDLPAWERNEETRAEDRVPTGYLDLLTWQSRRIRLRPPVTDGEPVRCVVIMKGNQFPDSWHRSRCETMLAFRRAPKAEEGRDPWPAVSFEQERAVWRDSLAIIQSVQGFHARPRIMTWLSDLASHGILAPSLMLPLDLLGICTNERNAAKVMLWRHQHLLVPLPYLKDGELALKLSEALAMAEGVRRALAASAKTMARLILAPDSDRAGARQPKPQDVSAAARRLLPERLYWGQLEVPFKRLMAALPQDIAPGEDGLDTYGQVAVPEWARCVYRASTAAFDESAAALGASKAIAKAVARAEKQLHDDLGTILGPYLPEGGDPKAQVGRTLE